MASATGTAKPERQRRSYRSRWLPGSRLGRLIIALNLLGVTILIIGALVLNELRRGLIEARIDSLTTQGELIANVIDRAATVGEPEPELQPQPEPLTASRPDPAREPVAPPIDLARTVDEIAHGVISRMQAAEHATMRHLEAMELEATRRYELVTAQAELDAELIRLQSRREAHAIITAARMRAGEVDDLDDDPGDHGHRLAVLSDAISRVADTTESSLTRSRTRETGPSR